MWTEGGGSKPDLFGCPKWMAPNQLFNIKQRTSEYSGYKL